MPWIWVGRYCFNLDDVALVARQGPNGSLTVTLRSSLVVDLTDQDAEAFLAAWEEHTGARRIERGPPYVLVPISGVPGRPASDVPGMPTNSPDKFQG